jgi:hypothetical protein
LDAAESLGHPVDPIALDVIPIVGQLVLYVEGDQHAAGHSDSQAGDIDEAVQFPLFQVAPGDLEKMTEHVWCLIALDGTKSVPFAE